MVFHLFSTLPAYRDFGLLAVRLAAGAIFLAHGLQKKAMWKMAPSEQMPTNMLVIMRILSIAEPLGGLALLFGFLTPLAALGLGIIMIGAMYLKMFTWKTPFIAMNKMGWEYDLILLSVMLLLIFNGAGTWGLDRIFFGW